MSTEVHVPAGYRVPMYTVDYGVPSEQFRRARQCMRMHAPRASCMHIRNIRRARGGARAVGSERNGVDGAAGADGAAARRH